MFLLNNLVILTYILTLLANVNKHLLVLSADVKETDDLKIPISVLETGCWPSLCQELDLSQFGCRCKFSNKDDLESIACGEAHFDKALSVLGNGTEYKPKNTSPCNSDESGDYYYASSTTQTSPTTAEFKSFYGKSVVTAPSMKENRKVHRRSRGMRSSTPLRNNHQRRYMEYPREKPDKIKYREKYTEAYHEHMNERVYSAVMAGTAVGRFSPAGVRSLLDLFRFRRSVDNFSNVKLKSSPGILYYTLSNLPNNYQNEDGVIAATLSEWAAKAPMCFRERVSTRDPPPNFSITFLAGQLLGRQDLISRTVSVSGKRQIQLNSDCVYKLGNGRANIQTESSLPAVILHEVGHLLGVPHSHDRARSSAMYDHFDNNNANNYLGSFESSRIQQLYGKCYGETDAITNILYDVGRSTYSTTFISRNNAVWEYSYISNRALGDYPIRNSQLFPDITGSIDAMVQIYTGSPGTTPLFYVFKGANAFQYTYSYNRTPRIYKVGQRPIYSLTRSRMNSVDAALWSEITSTLYLFSGGQVCSYGAKWDFLRCNSINFVFQGLGNQRIDEAYQYVNGRVVEHVFFRGKDVYQGTYNGRYWTIRYRGAVPNQRGYRWNDLCENLC